MKLQNLLLHMSTTALCRSLMPWLILVGIFLWLLLFTSFTSGLPSCQHRLNLVCRAQRFRLLRLLPLECVVGGTRGPWRFCGGSIQDRGSLRQTLLEDSTLNPQI